MERNVGIDLDSVGRTVGPFRYEYGFRDVALYALTVGADGHDLDYTVHSPARKVLPTFAVVPTVEPIFAALHAMRADTVNMVHLAHRTELLAPLPGSGLARTTATIHALLDMVMGALAIVDTETAIAGVPCSRTRWHILLRGAGGFGGPRPGPLLRTRPAEGQSPDFELDIPTRPEQALLYRLLGDMNPVHADPRVAESAGFARPILHGLCTYGIAARAALRAVANDEPRRFHAFEVRFAKPVVPGDTLRVRGFRLSEGRSAPSGARAETGGAPSGARAETGGAPSGARAETGGAPSGARAETGGAAPEREKLAITVTVLETGVEVISNGLLELTP